MPGEGTSWFKIQELNSTNWLAWKRRTTAVLRERELLGYVDSTISPADSTPPLTTEEQEALETWTKKDELAQNQIILTIAEEEMVHITRANTAKEMWDALVMVHEPRGGASVISAMRLLFRTVADEESNLEEHLTEIRRIQDQLQIMQADVPDWIYGAIMLSSLPPSWDAFASGFIGQNGGAHTKTPSRQMEVMIRDEYRRRIQATTSQVMAMQSRGDNRGVRRRDDIKCYNCDRKGHTKEQCWRKGGGAYGQGPKQREKEQANQANHLQDEKEETSGYFMAFHLTTSKDTVPAGTIAAADTRNPATFTRYDWLMDSGASTHIATERAMFTTYERHSEILDILGGQQMTSLGCGSIDLECSVDGKPHTLRLLNVLHIPNNKICLFSEGRFDAAGGKITSSRGYRQLVSNQQKTVAEARLTRTHMYLLNAKAKLHVESINTIQEPKPDWNEWHRRYGHIAVLALEKLAKEGLVTGLDVDPTHSPSTCEACIASKLTTRPFPKESETRASAPGERTFSDVWGPARTTSIRGSRYYITCTDDATRRTTVLFMRDKTEAKVKVINYFTYLERQLGFQPKKLRIDNGGEYVNEALKEWCGKSGVEIEPTALHSPSQNGVAERFNRTLMELARAMLIARNLPNFLWSEAVSYAAYLRNRAPTRALEGKTPHEAWTGEKPNVSHLREFGASVWIKIETPVSKLSPRAIKHVFVGFEDGPKAVKYYDAPMRSVKVSRNFTFTDVDPPKEVEILIKDNKLPIEGEKLVQKQSNRQQEEEVSPMTEKEDSEERVNSPITRIQRPKPPLPTPRILPSRKSVADIDYKRIANPNARTPVTKGVRPRAPHPEEETTKETNFVFAVAADMADQEEMPKTLTEARGSSERAQWEEAWQKEINQLLEKGVWEKTDLPPGRKALGCRMVFDKKYDADGNVKYKCRLVVKGYSQIPGYDYTETFAPVVRFDSLRTILALAAIHEWKIEAVDVKGAYLNADLDEELYMQQPEGFDDNSGQVLKLVKALYGTKQAGRAWYKTLQKIFTDHGAKPLDDDPSVYILRRAQEILVVTVWVDDMILAGSHRRMLDEVKEMLKSKFELTELGEPRKFLGVEVERDRNKGTISLGQNRYVENILKRMQLEGADVHSAPTPLDNAEHLLEASTDPNEKLHSPSEYATAIGMLMYAAICTRPDISFAVQTLSQFNQKPTETHWSAVKWVFRYLKKTSDYKLTYGGENTSDELIGYTDADWASDPNT